MDETFHPEKGPYLRSLSPGERFIGFYTLRAKQLEPFRDPTRGQFLTLVLSDRSGQVIARVWEDAEATYEKLPQGEVIKVAGEAEFYRGRLQVIARRVRPATDEEYDPRDMLPTSQRDPDEMLAALQGYIEQITNPHLRALVDYFYQNPDFLARFKQAPAARRIHHAYLGGLLEHTLEVLTLCQSAADLFPRLDADLLMSGALLHDIGKLKEYTWKLDIDYSTEGRLLGHIVMADEMVSTALQNFPAFPPELALRLRHMLLAHHGQLEWGSPRTPKTVEAIALHHIENLDAQINRFQSILDRRAPGESWSEYDRLLRRQLYGGEDDEEA